MNLVKIFFFFFLVAGTGLGHDILMYLARIKLSQTTEFLTTYKQISYKIISSKVHNI